MYVLTIQAKLAECGSPHAIFETTDDRLTFLVTIPVYECGGESSQMDVLGSETHHKSSEKKRKSSERQESSNAMVLTLVAIGK